MLYSDFDSTNGTRFKTLADPPLCSGTPREERILVPVTGLFCPGRLFRGAVDPKARILSPDSFKESYFPKSRGRLMVKTPFGLKSFLGLGGAFFLEVPP
jgi:hypothetical protein